MRGAMHEAPVGLTSLGDHSRTGKGKFEEEREDQPGDNLVSFMFST